MGLEDIVNRIHNLAGKTINSKLSKLIYAPCKPTVQTLDSIFEGFFDNFQENKIRNLSSYLAGVIISSPLYLYLHESLHHFANKLIGGVQYEISMSKYLGGSLINKILPWVTTDVSRGNLGSSLVSYPINVTNQEKMFVDLLPCALTIPGFVMLQKGIKERKPFWTASGTVFIIPTINLMTESLTKDKDIYNALNTVFSNPSISIIAALLTGSAMLYASRKIAEAYKPKKSGLRTALTGALAVGAIVGLTAFIAPKETYEQRGERLKQSGENLLKVYNYNAYLREIERLEKEFPDASFIQYKTRYPDIAVSNIISLDPERRTQETIKAVRGASDDKRAEIAVKLMECLAISDEQSIDAIMDGVTNADECMRYSLRHMSIRSSIYFLKKYPGSRYYDEIKEHLKLELKEWYESLECPDVVINYVQENVPIRARQDIVDYLTH